MSLQRYSEYKDSGVEWLREVPANWTTTKLGRLLKAAPCYGVLVPDFEEDGVPMLRITDMEEGCANRSQLTTISRALSGQYERTIVEEGDIVLSVVGTIGEALVVDSRLAGVNLSRAVARIQPTKSLQASFLYWICCGLVFRHYVDLICVGTAQRVLNMGDLSAYLIALPSVAEQAAVVRFLGTETAKIDALIAEQERLIDLLLEKRRSVISHVLTKGLDPSVPMKFSGLNWFGDVPAKWNVVPIKRLIHEIESGTSVNASAEPADDGEVGVLNTSCVYSGVFNPSENKCVVQDEKDRVSCPLKIGALIVSRMNTPELIGLAGLVTVAPKNLFLPDRLWQVIITGADPRFVHFWTHSAEYRAQVVVACSGASSSMKSISQDQFRSFKIAIPSLEEQRLIVEFLGAETARMDELIAEAQRATALLKERRSALISAAVTGQIDVRGLVEQEAA